MCVPPPPVRSAPLQTRKFVVQSRIRSVGESGIRPSSDKRKPKSTSTAQRMGLHAPYEGTYGKAALVLDQDLSTIPIDWFTSAADIDELTDHCLLPDLLPVPRSVLTTKLHRCRHCCQDGQTITS